ncbi:MAG: hypothetical protein U5K69_07245 [Balneolaceae bacterium]|nr:hypothetical protein [Balneolaceae bacterium]
MFCFLAGSMIAVSATAVGLPFGIAMPGLGDWMPTSIGWVITVFAVGLVITLIAVLGYDYVARFANLAFPWMILVFIAAALAMLTRSGATSISDFWTVANEKIWTGVPAEGQSKFTFWHVTFFAWFANMAMHIGMSDMSILRFAEKWQHGFSSATGMFFGHFIAWMASGILTAAAAGAIAPGLIAYNSAGVAGAICVVIAGWTTANPTIYRAGLALSVGYSQLETLESDAFYRVDYSHSSLFPCACYAPAGFCCPLWSRSYADGSRNIFGRNCISQAKFEKQFRRIDEPEF